MDNRLTPVTPDIPLDQRHPSSRTPRPAVTNPRISARQRAGAAAAGAGAETTVAGRAPSSCGRWTITLVMISLRTSTRFGGGGGAGAAAAADPPSAGSRPLRSWKTSSANVEQEQGERRSEHDPHGQAPDASSSCSLFVPALAAGQHSENGQQRSRPGDPLHPEQVSRVDAGFERFAERLERLMFLRWNAAMRQIRPSCSNASESP